ncbi:MAG: VanZ family protein [Patescibacteria group bacterium]
MLGLIVYWVPPLIWGGVIFLFSSLARVRTSDIYWQDFLLKKSAHIIEYAILTILLYRAFRNSQVKGAKRAMIYSILISIFYSITDEIHQSFVPGRESRIRDVVFDTIGASLAIYVIWKLLPKAPQRLKLLAKKLQLI